VGSDEPAGSVLKGLVTHSVPVNGGYGNLTMMVVMVVKVVMVDNVVRTVRDLVRTSAED
jgi:hypothetical protein